MSFTEGGAISKLKMSSRKQVDIIKSSEVIYDIGHNDFHLMSYGAIRKMEVSTA